MPHPIFTRYLTGVRNLRRASSLSLHGLLGRSSLYVTDRFGTPATDRRVGADRWLVYERPDLRLRVRCSSAESGDTGEPRAPSSERVASWTVSFHTGLDTLREAAEALGLWPVCSPDERPGSDRLLRRVLPDPVTGEEHSLTATVRDGSIVQLSAFDEPPEWLSPTVADES